MKKILITGGKGLVGSSFKSGEKPSSKELNLFNYQKSFNHIKTLNPDIIFHCAARVGGLYDNMMNQADFFDQNVMINSNILKISKELKINKFIGFLSTCIFPDNLNKPLEESDLHLGPPHKSNFGYSYAKRMFDIQVQAYNEQYGLKYFNVIPTNVYGVNDNYNIKTSHVIPGLIHKTFLAKKQNTDLIIWGSGKAKREFIFAEDLSNICTQLTEKYNGNSPIIISPSHEISIKDLVDLIVEISNFKGKVIYDKSKSDGQLIKNTNTSKLQQIIPNFKFTSIENGLHKTINWFFSNYDKARK
jgi:GDP-L-fucose synthase